MCFPVHDRLRQILRPFINIKRKWASFIWYKRSLLFKQCRPRSHRSHLIWVYTVCLSLILKLANICSRFIFFRSCWLCPFSLLQPAFFQNKLFWQDHQSDKQFGPRSGSTSCQAWSGPKFVRGSRKTARKQPGQVFFYFFIFLQFTEGVQWFYYRENYTFPRIQRGSNIFQGESNFFSGGGGSKCLFL